MKLPARSLPHTVVIPALLSATMLACLNMPTPTSQITGSYSSGLRYEQFDCNRLDAEISSLARRENVLVIAQGQRIKTSQMQAFWWGFGQGDGIEAAELASVRGEKEAIRNAMDGMGCAISTAPIAASPDVEDTFCETLRRRARGGGSTAMSARSALRRKIASEECDQ